MDDKRLVAYVEWVDSQVLAATWDDRAEVLSRVDHNQRLLAAGFVVQLDGNGIVLAATVNPHHDDIASCIAIPKSAIRKIVLWAPAFDHGD